jgi:hypothetical protein
MACNPSFVVFDSARKPTTAAEGAAGAVDEPWVLLAMAWTKLARDQGKIATELMTYGWSWRIPHHCARRH